MSIAKLTTITASSSKSWEDAASTGIQRASKTLRNITGFKIIEQKAKVENGKIQEFRITMEIIFLLED